MFYSASAFNQNLAAWNTARVSIMSSVRSVPVARVRAADGTTERVEHRGVDALFSTRMACRGCACLLRWLVPRSLPYFGVMRLAGTLWRHAAVHRADVLLCIGL
jgi:surface protein